MKNAFTLVELLGVIVLLGIIAAITVPTVQNFIKKSRTESFFRQRETIVSAAKRWCADNGDSDSLVSAMNDGGSCYLSISKLQSDGYLASNKEIKNPATNTKMTGCVKVSFDKDYKQYSYRYISSGCGTSC